MQSYKELLEKQEAAKKAPQYIYGEPFWANDRFMAAMGFATTYIVLSLAIMLLFRMSHQV